MVNPEELEKHIAAIMGFRAQESMRDIEQMYIDRLPIQMQNELRTALEVGELQPELANVISEKDEPWYRPTWFPGSGNWKRYRQVLVEKGLDEKLVIDVIDNTTTRILCELSNPSSFEDFQTYGLVLGYVQSGKTANYTGLIAKAVDSGYDFVIVLAGLHNNLRLQTQHRLDRELTGVDHENIPGVKVELPPPEASWLSLTLDDDFNVQGNARHTVSSSRPVYAVMKKNVVVMEKFLAWLEGAGETVLERKKLLLIDDEADHATVNTGSGQNTDDDQYSIDEYDDYDITPGDLDPSRTNECIRKILKLFNKRSYVGYTATPFANVLIDPYEHDSELGPTLYPRDFIISLPKPRGYIGAEDMFPEDLNPSSLEGQVRIIPSEQSERIRNTTEPEGLPSEYCGIESSLRDAMLDYILTGCVKIHRGHKNFHHSMLIHIHHMKEVQNWLAEKVNQLWNVMYNYLRYSNQNSELIDDLETRWSEHFQLKNEKTVETWEQLRSHLNYFAERVVIREINSDNPNGDLDYHNHSNGLFVIAVGGNKLSRGLTLEGLTISYFVRPTKMYDSLLQMGRWFGFRPDYGDLVRLYLTAELLEWFSWLAHVERQIRVDIERYDRLNKSPLDLAVRIQTHPQLYVTSRLKMRSSREIRVGWDGQTAQTLYFNYDDVNKLRQNLKIGSDFVSHLSTIAEMRRVDSHYIWSNIEAKNILQFIDSINLPDHPTFDRKNMSKYIENRVNDDELNSWNVALISLKSKNRSMVELGGLQVNTVLRSRSMGTQKIPDLVDSKHWSIDLEGHPEKYESETGYYPKKLMLDKRNKDQGLLLIYVLDSEGTKSSIAGREMMFENTDDKAHVLALGIAFPLSDSAEGERGEFLVVKGVESDEN